MKNEKMEQNNGKKAYTNTYEISKEKMEHNKMKKTKR